MRSRQCRIEQGDPLNQSADGLIHPTTGDRAPAGERLDTFYERAGPAVRDGVEEGQPIRIGEVLVTDGGELPFRTIVHAPVQTAPGVPTTLDNVQTALRSALVTIDREGIHSVVCPRPFPDTLESVEPREVAECILDDVYQYPPVHLREIRFVDVDAGWIRALRSIHSARDRRSQRGLLETLLDVLPPW